MMIECPACATRYEVPDNAIGPGGRNVRCAKCSHRWQEYGNNAPVIEEVEAEVSHHDESPADPLPEEPRTEAAHTDQVVSDPIESVQADLPSAEEPVVRGPRERAEPTLTRLDKSPPQSALARRGSPVRLLVWAAIIVLLVAVAAFASARLLGMPDWVPGDRSSFASGEPGLQLNFPDEQLGMRQLPDGTEIFGARGTITNVGETARSVPPILIVLRDAHDRIVYSWEVMPAKRNLAPGESVAVNEAVTDVPRSARVADIGWKPG